MSPFKSPSQLIASRVAASKNVRARRRRVALNALTLEARDCPAGNLIANPSVEAPNAALTAPTSWSTGSFGSNLPVFSYPKTGLDGQRSVRVDMLMRGSGDAKWYFNDVAVTPGQTYTFSDLYTSNVATSATVRYLMTNGTYKYVGNYVAPASSTSGALNFNFTAPANAVSATVFHLINSVGYLATDAFSLAPTGSPVPDTIAPTVSITAPTANTNVSGTFNLTAQASDNIGVAGVRFLVDGVQVGAEDTVSPYQVSLNAATLTGGSHTVTAIARDAAANSTTSAAIAFNVATADTTAPVVSVTSPAANASLSGTTTLTASATDNVGVVGVRFLVDGVQVGAEDTTSPYQASLNTATLTAGSHTVTAIARDAAANSATSAAIAFNVVTVDTTLPTISVTSPTANANVSGTLMLSATASDNVGVVGVRFLVDGVQVGSEVTASPYQVSLNTATLTGGSHTVTAIARDAAANSKTSTPVAFNVTVPDTTLPSVAITAPTANASVSGTITLAATASDNVGVVGVRFLVDGVQVGAEITVAPYQASLNTSSLTIGSHSVTAVARDLAGNSKTSAAIAFNVSDSTAPTVSITSPAANATTSGTVTLTAQAADNVGVADVRFFVDGAQVGSVDTATPYQVSLNTTTLSNGSHSITAIARDAAGNSTTSGAVAFSVSNGTATPTNLIQNPSLETLGTNGTPTGWSANAWGTNTPTFTVVAGVDGSHAVRVDMASYSSGDAKWVFSDVPVSPNTVYTFSDAYRSSAASQLLARYTAANGSVTYAWISDLAPAANWTNISYQVTTPANVASMTVFHLIFANGWLETDKYSLAAPSSGGGHGMVSLTFDDGWLSQLQSAVPVLQQNNLPASFYVITRANEGGAAWEEVQNRSLESAGDNGSPLKWSTAQTGTNTSVFSYAGVGSDGAHSARIDVQSYTNGDAAWYFQDVMVQPGTQYSISHQFNSNVPTSVVVRFTRHDGSVVYVDAGTVAATNGQWQTQNFNVTAPANADAMTVMHRIKQVGSLSTDNYSVKEINAYSNPDYMTPAQIQSLQASGYEVGVHTMTHADLTTESAAGALAEIDGARADLINLGITPKTFVYPYGAYNTGLEQIIASDGFIGARTVNEGFNSTTPADPYSLRHHEVDLNTTVAQVQAWIDAAAQTGQWLILTFHQVDHSGDFYSTTPETFQQIAALVKASNLTPVTMGGGLTHV